MKTNILTFILMLASFAESLLSEEDYTSAVDVKEICTDVGGDPHCTDDKTGYITVKCRWKWPNNYDDSTLTYTKCPRNQECVCDQKICNADLICQDKEERDPEFPKTGQLTYTGSSGGYDGEADVNYTWSGKTVLDEEGRFYAEYRDYRHGPGWIQRFLILLPSDDGYKKITGWFGNKDKGCWMEDINEQPWLYRNYIGRPMRGNKKIFEGEENGKYIQRWKNTHYDVYWSFMGEYDSVTYTYEYDPGTNLAIPLKYDHYFQYDGADRRDIKNYVYSPIIEDESVFDVNKFCDKFYGGNGDVVLKYLPN